MKIGCIVEGHGEVAAIRPLLERIFAVVAPDQSYKIESTIRVKRNQVVREGELERHLELLGSRVGSTGLILVLLDADDDCAATLGPALLSRCRVARNDRKLSVVLAVHEFEAWFLASLASLRGFRGIPNDAPEIENPEAVRSPKGRLDALMGGRYQETVDQPALAGRIDVELARRRSPSFDKLVRDLLLQLVGRAISPATPE